MKTLFSVFLILLALTASEIQGKKYAKRKKTSHAHISDTPLQVSNGCATVQLGDISYSGSTAIPDSNWVATPSVYEVQPGEYRVFGRTVHMNYLREQLQLKGVTFDALRLQVPPQVSVEVQADTVYIQGTIELFGVQRLKMLTREIIGATDSVLSISAPNWDPQAQQNAVTTSNPRVKNGFNGPTVEIFADELQGKFSVVANGGNGLRGKDGANGRPGVDNNNEEPGAKESDCSKQRFPNCGPAHGTPGTMGRAGNPGADGGEGGNGGNSGTLTVLVNRIYGNVQLTTCRGTGAPSGRGGNGGRGGKGSYAGTGVICYPLSSPTGLGLHCYAHSYFRPKDENGNRLRGEPGSPGSPGETPDPGIPGSISDPAIRSTSLDTAAKESYPLTLLRVMKRHSEDLLWADDLTKAKKVLRFLKLVTADRRDDSDINNIYREAKRRLAFVGKSGFDLFGNNELFAPRIKYEVLKSVVEDIREYATDYENSYNSMRELIENEQTVEALQQIANSAASTQVQAERDRLFEARKIAESEKALYARAIQSLEDKMDNILTQIEHIIPEAHQNAQFNTQDVLVLLKGISGFVSAVGQKDPLGTVEQVYQIAGELASTLSCPTSSLDSIKDNLRKWLTFGESYQPLDDSSELDFDQFDIEAVPEMMQANLEVQKEKLTAELVCLLDVRSLPQEIAQLKQLLDQFFINGASRIDLIAKIIDLDNQIGGYSFDIPLLEETQRSLTSVSEPIGFTATEENRVQFMEHLLNAYQELEGSFMKEIYDLYKAFKFKNLWETDALLPEFHRVASEGARGGRLNGILELTNVLQSVQSLEAEAVTCFSHNRYSTAIHRWTFNTTTHQSIFNDLRNGEASAFTIDIINICPTCFNQRLQKLYIEFRGQQAQPNNVPDKVHFLLRHKGGSFFRNGDGNIKDYRQHLGSFRKMKFRRFAVSDQKKCRQAQRAGNELHCSVYCVTEDDHRFQPMCNQPTSLGACADSLLGEEECRSPFGTYELVIPVDTQLNCDEPGIQNRNCKDLQVSRFDTMNVWASFYFWPGSYPTGPDDTLCQ